MTEDAIYSITCFHRREFDGDKPFFALQATSQDEAQRLERTFQPTARALNYVRENLDAFMFEVDASQWISGHIQIGRTLDGDFVVLSVEGFVENQEYGADGAIIVCAPDDYEQLLADLSTKACRAAAKTRKSLSAMLQRN